MRFLLSLLLILLASNLSAQAQTYSDPATASTDSTVSSLVNPTVSALENSVPVPPTVGGDFTLTSQNNTRVTSANFRGNFMLVTFGYTHCGDSCSPAPGAMIQALGILPTAQSNHIWPIFVTLDPSRDTPPVLKAFLAQYGNRMIGLTGSPGEIDRMVRSYSVYSSPVENMDIAVERSLSPQALADWRRDRDYRPPSGETYTISHSRFIYLMGPDGKLVTILNGDIGPDYIAKGIAAAIQ